MIAIQRDSPRHLGRHASSQRLSPFTHLERAPLESKVTVTQQLRPDCKLWEPEGTGHRTGHPDPHGRLMLRAGSEICFQIQNVHHWPLCGDGE